MVEKYFDHHVHNGFSRCVKVPFSVESAFNVARARGFIEGIGITNHCHMNSPDQSHLEPTRMAIDQLNSRLGETRVLLGVELDIDHPSGRFVLSEKSLSIVDYVVAGPHNMPHRSLAFPDMEREDFDEYFAVLHDILVNSFEKNPIDIWPHPFLQEIEIGGTTFEKYIFDILDDVLPVLAEKGIAMEISSTFLRDKDGTVEIRNKSDKDPGWLQIAKITNKIYKLANDFGKISFSFASD
ncbi:MAG: hypothetical protein ACTSWN_15680, partial [Promethearchaeota archaeon]